MSHCVLCRMVVRLRTIGGLSSCALCKMVEHLMTVGGVSYCVRYKTLVLLRTIRVPVLVCALQDGGVFIDCRSVSYCVHCRMVAQLRTIGGMSYCVLCRTVVHLMTRGVPVLVCALQDGGAFRDHRSVCLTVCSAVWWCI